MPDLRYSTIEWKEYFRKTECDFGANGNVSGSRWQVLFQLQVAQKVNDFLQTVERERLAELHETDIQKKAEINRQRGERLLKAVRENRDNIISAYALSQVYTEMSYEELKPYLSDDYAFSHHILLSPMREYVEGLEKRRPGTPYTNLELVDTKGRPHQLSEYIGKGYVSGMALAVMDLKSIRP